MRDPEVTDLIAIFNSLFLGPYNTELVEGDDEPIYRPADDEHRHHRIIFAHGFFASALHEIAHWCVAGPERRTLVDFGYWYKPDGRTEQEQAEFERVEVQPQAYEWILTRSAGRRFNFSADNLSAGLGASDQFKRNVHRRVDQLLEEGLPPRVDQLSLALRRFYDQPALDKKQFDLSTYVESVYAKPDDQSFELETAGAAR
ncbi:MAG: ATPase [Oceanospirillaceae bacterium]|jgi:elongation factor P hydroxylase|uniref:elongation factor P hydroxylase n=1 Tax=Marinobacterium litorale TaxID=404770 RepID=UPI000409D2D0|nr:elongation factor P hydroxylase [Marinobacterium litorale]MBT00200.1 ATPase [Oceanospirillaceae bacterium]